MTGQMQYLPTGTVRAAFCSQPLGAGLDSSSVAISALQEGKHLATAIATSCAKRHSSKQYRLAVQLHKACDEWGAAHVQQGPWASPTAVLLSDASAGWTDAYHCITPAVASCSPKPESASSPSWASAASSSCMVGMGPAAKHACQIHSTKLCPSGSETHTHAGRLYSVDPSHIQLHVQEGNWSRAFDTRLMLARIPKIADVCLVLLSSPQPLPLSGKS